MFTIYSADVTGNASNCLYPHRHIILEETTLREAVSHDYVCAEYLGGRRSNSSFIGSDCLPVDCDNDHTDDPAGWVRPEDVMAAFPGVEFAVHYSRNNMREKNGKAPRPKFHILFPIARVTDAEQYSRMKKAVSAVFPRIDANALDAARFFFGTEDAEVDYWPGKRDLTEFLAEAGFSCEDPGSSGGPAPEAPASPAPDTVGKSFSREVIPQGRRNSRLSRFAGSVLKKYGICKEARKAFDDVAALCEPPLEKHELEAIWQSATNFYSRVSAEDGYIEPEIYNLTPRYRPADFTDAGQAEMLKLHYCGRLRYSPATGFICYNGRYWEESETKAQAIALELTEFQLREASGLEVKALEVMRQNGAENVLMDIQSSKLGRHLTGEQKKSCSDFEMALQYQKFVLRCRNAGGIESVLAASRHLLEIDPDELDADCFALNTPAGVYDLRKGLEGLRPHDPEDLITKITAVSPGMEGIELWQECLDTIFCGDDELTRYVQLICGLAAIGKVYVESLIIAYGAGRNGKSTFWNTVSRVLGKYSGNISADTLTVGCRRNVKPELAETKGKRILIAAEMQEGARLNDSTVKQLCSTDDIFAEKKYKAPFSFRPCHTLVLYTNHLPRVSGSDEGTWRRLTVIPFGAKIEGSSDIKNYADYLFENAGGAILSWIIEGARQVIEMDYRLPVPGCVREAIDEYRSSNDWFAHFVEDRCETGETYSESSAALYQAYRNYCLDMNEYVRSTTDFYAELEKRGFKREIVKREKRIKGLRIRQFRGSDPDLY